MLDSRLLPLQSERVRLRALRAGDAAAFAAGTEDPDVKTYGHLPEPKYTTESVITMIERQAEPGLARGDLAVLAIAHPVTDEFAGSLVIFDVTDEVAEVGFWVHPSHRGTGVATAALHLAGELARGSGLTTLTARTATENVASQGVLVRAGFQTLGTRKDTTPSGQEIELLHYVWNLGES
ncbi:ribosomal-protein-alanine N-acetyltransferase [Mycobacterium frederiksbergense]|uniref:Ribosomal-protein-alanine N-acetyltransferase n=1 Tax=Mycolicibacterium frederiksbergense TaxID=117567 RepID=A0ABT6KZ84_9MYCO|nr:GNAT family protein [Mycolicibacterium frederiksbergense]MDH6195996.1 ribosomal-protein-alanine N-acetyltransferase [Mycolicibacterium frederiksbergense]